MRQLLRLCGMEQQRLRGVLARNLRRLRRGKGLSQEELAGHAGLNRNYVGMIEREENSATVDVIERLADVLGVRAADLLLDENGESTVTTRSGSVKPR